MFDYEIIAYRTTMIRYWSNIEFVKTVRIIRAQEPKALGMDEILRVPYKSCCFSATSA